MSGRVTCLLLAVSGCASAGPQVRSLELKVRRQEVVMRCTPSDAEVALDGVGQGRCDDFAGRPRGLPLKDGPHRVVVSRQGYFPWTGAVDADGTQVLLSVTLVKQ